MTTLIALAGGGGCVRGCALRSGSRLRCRTNLGLRNVTMMVEGVRGVEEETLMRNQAVEGVRAARWTLMSMSSSTLTLSEYSRESMAELQRRQIHRPCSDSFAGMGFAAGDRFQRCQLWLAVAERNHRLV